MTAEPGARVTGWKAAVTAFALLCAAAALAVLATASVGGEACRPPSGTSLDLGPLER
ncbi:hypothetical protein [Hansschlegelia sp.]|uniref:hypothetical protein n=1 Tax=Hansschlegelia sp. TaxID=2041892 RepID=UPI002D17CB04|nr:hypothetical protein [Hansschlegelia sp.]HVI27579.1 hypothetical protein [Hansschlegelia sp.]